MTETEKYDPVPFDVAETHARWMLRPGYADAYAATNADDRDSF